MDNKQNLKNVKISENLHAQVKKISDETGINIGKLIEYGVLKVVEQYSNGFFDNIIIEHSKLRRNGSFNRN